MRQKTLLWSNGLTETRIIDLQTDIIWMSLQLDFQFKRRWVVFVFIYDHFIVEKYVEETAEMLIRCCTL